MAHSVLQNITTQTLFDSYPSLVFDILGGIPLPNCPYPATAIVPSSTLPRTAATIYAGDKAEQNVLFNPTVSVTYLSLGIMCLGFGLVAGLRMNAVRVFNRKIKDPSVRNVWWALFFSCLGAR